MATRGRKPKTRAEKSAFSNKVASLKNEGYEKAPGQASAIAYSELRRGGLSRLKRFSGRKRKAA